MRRTPILVLASALLFCLGSCGGSPAVDIATEIVPVSVASATTAPAVDTPVPSEEVSTPPEPTPVSTTTGGLLQPEDLLYLGAFRLPDGPSDEIGWKYSGEALAYYPEGDPGGPDDGFPGSLFGTGHNWNQWVSEISIPAPVNSPSKNLEDLSVATTLQEFQDIRGDLYPAFEIPRAGLAILPPQGEQTSPKLYFSWTQHMNEGDTSPSHGWCELDLSSPQSAGPWRIGDYWTYVTTDYLFPIPSEWANANVPGKLLATGRFRDGGQGAQGPSLFAYGPWNEGNPPAAGSTLSAVPLLLYGDVYTEGSPTMRDYHHSDDWSGGAWLTAGGRSAVVFVGTKGTGDCWYGCSDGTVWPDEPPFPEACPDFDRGWWSTQFEGQMIFYNPDELAAVARGELEPSAPQPYATLNIDPVLYHIASNQQKNHVGDVTFDRERGLLYVMEPLVDDDKSLVHVWRVGTGGSGTPAAAALPTPQATTAPAAPQPPTEEPAATEEPVPTKGPVATEVPSPPPSGTATRIMFLHHSCGANLIAQGGVREGLTALGYEFYDHGYNDDGLVLADGTWTGQNYDIPDDNTDPNGLAVLFSQPLRDPADNAFSRLMQYDVLAFKSCFPTSLIESDEQLAEDQSYYRSMRDRMDQLPDKLFIVVTQPPEIPNDTDRASAQRARALASWLASDEFLEGRRNVVTFNFFDLLADPATNMLRVEYRTDEYDAHPNELANRTIGPLFVEFVDRAIKSFAAR